jgi:pumilio RNA-binding family
MSIQNDQQQQYIPAVPVQRNGSPNRNSYTYIQTQNDPYSGPHQPVTNIPGGNANTVHVRSAYAGQSFPPQQQVQQRQPQQHHHQSTSSQASGGGRGGKEKSGRNNRRSGNNINNVGNPQQRRSGGSDSRNSGADGNHSPSQTDIGSHSLLEDFKEKKNSRDWTVKDIKGHVVDFCQDQNGSRFVQQRLEVGDAAEKAIAMTEVLPAIRALRNDVFGNYVVQKLLDFGSPTMKEQIRVTMTGEMVELSVQMYGCRVVQKALESLDEASLPKLLEEFHNNVLSLIHDQNGNHVIQKCIEIISQKAKQARNDGDDAKAAFFNEQIDFIVDDVMMNLASLACHPYGCRVLQRILEHCTEEKKNFVLDELRPSHRRLLDDQYGNYVIQHVLQFGRVEDRDLVLAVVVENGLLKLSKQKFASNVVEKLLKYGNAEQRKAVAREMLKLVDEDTDEVVTNGGHGTSVVLLMVRDAYANYVVQTTIDVVPPQSRERKKLVEELNKHSTELVRKSESSN